MERKFLEDMGLEKEAIDKIMAENGNDIEAQKQKTKAAETARDSYKETLEGVQKDLKAFKGVDVNELNGKIADLQGKLDTKDTEHKAAMDAVTQRHAAEKYLGTHKFSSQSAQKAALNDFLAAEMTFDEKTGKFLGQDDFMKKMKESDPRAFVKEDNTTPPPDWQTNNQNPPKNGDGMSFSFTGVRPQPDQK